MDLATFATESALNRQAYEELREYVRREYAGQYVALANGRVIGAANTFDAAHELVKKLEVMPQYYLVFAAEAEPDFDLTYDLAGSQ